MSVVSFGSVQVDIDSIEVVDLYVPKRTRMPRAFMILKRDERVPSMIFWEGTPEFKEFTEYMSNLEMWGIIGSEGVEVAIAAPTWLKGD